MGAKGVGTNVDRQDIMGILYRHEPRDRDSLTQVAGMILRQKACIACLFICLLSQEPVDSLAQGRPEAQPFLHVADRSQSLTK